MALFVLVSMVITHTYASCVNDTGCSPCKNENNWNAWTSWNCAQVNPCTQGTRVRSKFYQHVFPCCSCWERTQTEPCGDVNNGCQHQCSTSDGSCSCNDGYELSGGKSCVKQKCNAIVPSACPYMQPDKFGNVCTKVVINCPQGRELGGECRLSCLSNYTVKKLSGVPFGSQVEPAHPVVSCEFSGGQMKWNNIELSQYYCRRTNDPPSNLQLSASSITEHAPVGTIIGVISAQDTRSPSLVYTLQQSQGVKQFNIDGNTLKNSQVFKLANTKDNQVSVTIRATDGEGMYVEKTFIVVIVNVNDPPSDVKISNNVFNDLTPVGTVIGKLSAIDPDVDNPMYTSGNYTWQLIQGSQHFLINGSDVVLKTLLGKDEDKITVIKVRCSDMTDSTIFLDKQLTMHQQNHNDAPQNLLLTLHTTLYENTQQSTVIGHVSASDWKNQTISFSLSPDTFALSTQVTCKDGTSGEKSCQADIVLQKALDYEVTSFYDVMLKATDLHGEEASKTFRLDVVNVNEPPYDIQLADNTIVENFVGKTTQIIVSDPDKNSKFTCSLNNSTKEFEAKGTRLHVKQGLDYEKQQKYLVNITCADDGSPPLSVTKVFAVNVQDVNEPPSELCITRHKIPTSSQNINDTLTQIIIEDPDVVQSLGACGTGIVNNDVMKMYTCSIKYETSAPSGLLSIESDMSIKVQNSLQAFSLQGFIKFKLTCRDSMLNSRSITVTLILDENPCPAPYVKHGNKCTCGHGLSGLKCDRNEMLCKGEHGCNATSTCSTLIKARHRCIGKTYQIPVLLRVGYSTYLSGDYRYKMEKYVVETLQGKTPSFPQTSRKRRSVSDLLTIESTVGQPVGQQHSFVVFIPRGPALLSAVSLCQQLEGNQQLHCLNDQDCEIMARYDLPCNKVVTSGAIVSPPDNKTNTGLLTWHYVSIAAAVLVLLFVLSLLVRYKRRNRNEKPVVYYNAQRLNNMDTDSPKVGHVQNAVKHNDIHVKENKLFENSREPLEMHNPAYGISIANENYYNDNMYASIGKSHTKRPDEGATCHNYADIVHKGSMTDHNKAKVLDNEKSPNDYANQYDVTHKNDVNEYVVTHKNDVNEYDVAKSDVKNERCKGAYDYVALPAPTVDLNEYKPDEGHYDKLNRKSNLSVTREI